MICEYLFWSKSLFLYISGVLNFRIIASLKREPRNESRAVTCVSVQPIGGCLFRAPHSKDTFTAAHEILSETSKHKMASNFLRKFC